jgi:hypothetical protein
MNNIPFQTIGLTADDIELFLDVYTTLGSKFDIRLEESISFDFDIDRFETCKGFEVELRELINIGDDCYISFVETFYSTVGNKGSRRQVHEFHAWGISKLHNNFGHVVIKPEGFSEKLSELIRPVELDFEEDPTFCRKFYVLAKDKQAAIRSINSSFRAALLKTSVKDFYLEIYGDILLVATDRIMIPEEALHMAALIKSLAAIR